MIVRTYPAELDLKQTVFHSLEEKDVLFFDIETTGLAASSSSLYLIGAAFFCRDRWQIRQWFAENPQEESSVLKAFLDFSSAYAHLIHFNGEHFDLPYLAWKSEAYQLRNPLAGLVSHDLYCMARPLKKILKLSSLRQKALEEYLGLFREDRFHGGELISVYHHYVRRPSQELLQTLLLHNYEDMLGMLALLPLFSCRLVLDGSYRMESAEVNGDHLILRALLPLAAPQPISWQDDHFYLTVLRDRLSLQVNGLRDCLKHFFENYKDYYYLPLEDAAIHKSVAAYVEKDYRVPAKAATCYSKMDGFYLPQFAPLFSPVMKENYADRLLYFPCTEEFLNDKNAQHDYAVHLIHHI